jgi:hypothetical protein
VPPSEATGVEFASPGAASRYWNSREPSYSLGYSSADIWYLGAGLRWEFLRSEHPFAINAEPKHGLSLAASYETRFGGQPDVIWLSLLYNYVPARAE